MYHIQVGYGPKGSYKTRYSFENHEESRAYFTYRCVNIGNGFKKRLVKDGKVLDRVFS